MHFGIPVIAGAFRQQIRAAQQILALCGRVQRNRRIPEHIIQHHEGRRTPMPCMAVEMQPCVLRQAPIELNELIHRIRRRPNHVRCGKAHIMETCRLSRFPLRLYAHDRNCALAEERRIAFPQRNQFLHRSRELCQQMPVLHLHFKGAASEIRLILRLIPAHGNPVGKPMGFLPQVHEIKLGSLAGLFAQLHIKRHKRRLGRLCACRNAQSVQALTGGLCTARCLIPWIRHHTKTP